ncbi:threonine aspartase 1 isoform X2 [Ischnura elegans]|uniref:threonine aspartase 1 isoform X2 n=1 Tax=Ischnura elegans TaxID=197161 RepID=UPI001ED8A9F6|nr:threonine aspartase 1 isoform X2 [Ischnura elegans]
MHGFIGVHIGAGNHSEGLSREYKRLCRSACRVVDAGVMEGETLAFGGVGAAPGMCHPVVIASELCKIQSKGFVAPSGLVAPSLLVGSGATKWAEISGLSHALSSSLISEKAKRQYHRNKRKLQPFRKDEDFEMVQPPCSEDRLDTVGVVAMDAEGRVSAACSSGGIALKQPGRVGQAAIFGAGCWAENCGARGPGDGFQKESIAVCTTGCGEYLVRTGLAQQLAQAVQFCDDIATVRLHSAFTEKFLRSPLLRLVDETGRLAGAIVLRGIGTAEKVEFLWAHSTKTMCIGYMVAAPESKPKSHMSRLPVGFTPGSKVNVEGINLNLNSELG